ncbi:MAG TPA: hypothetical protein VF896_13480, partial [Anaerolineales bacterium]
MKKLLYVLSVLVIGSMLLAACAPAATQAPATQAATQAPATQAATEAPAATVAPTVAAPAGKVLIRWSIGAGTGADPAQIPIENEVVADFNA